MLIGRDVEGDGRRIEHFAGDEVHRFGPQIDTLAALDNWVENGVPPSGLIMVDGTDSETRGRTRPVCEYPAFPKYNGDGDINDASSFHCALE